MEKRSNSKNIASLNIIIILCLVLIAAGLIILSRSLASPNASLTQEAIEKKQAELTTNMRSASAGSDPAETASPSSTQTPDNPAAYVFIIIDNRVWGIEALGEERDVTVDQGDGVINVVHILPNGYYMLSSTCENQLCVSEGTVTVTNYQQRILGPCVYCLPHNLMLELVVPGATADPSAPDV
ncbi:MAG: hypothetical protein IKQ41_00550 [Clostridia bacterium]|nr:hypothetical protein [Clostridia bacterium]